jgi:hypothetical protein
VATYKIANAIGITQILNGPEMWQEARCEQCARRTIAITLGNAALCLLTVSVIVWKRTG